MVSTFYNSDEIKLVILFTINIISIFLSEGVAIVAQRVRR